MKNWKKLLSLVLSVSLCLGITVSVTAADSGNGETASEAVVENEVIDVSDMEVGDIVYVGDIAIEKVSDDALPPIETRTTTPAYNAFYDGEQEDRQFLNLSNKYQYFYIWFVNEENSNWMITIGNTEEVQDRNYHVVGKGTTYVWSTKAWDPEETEVGYTCGAGMYGQTSARLCSTLKEAVDHGK